MATEINIDPPFEDENEFRKRLEDQAKNGGKENLSEIIKNDPDRAVELTREWINSGQPEIENDLPGSPNAVPFQNVKPGDKSGEQEAKDIEQKERKRYRREQQERLADFQRQQTEQRRAQQQAKKDEIAASREIVRDIRSQAISQRVESYSLAAAVGLPGYITASVVDSLYIRPTEDKRVKQEQDYQAELARYYEQVRKDAEAQAAAERAAIKNAPMQATVFDEQGKPIPPTTPPSSSPPTPPPVSPPPTPGPPVPPPGGGQPPIPPVPPTPAPPNSPPPVPPTPGGPQPPPIPPTPPGRPPVSGPSVSPAIIITAAVEAAQAINGAVDKAGQAVSQTGQDVVNGNYTSGVKNIVKGAQSAFDPLGVNVPVNVAVQGFNALLDINQSILDAAKENIGFAPESLGADVNADISRLLQQISISQRTDATTAELIRANRQLEEAWAEVKVKLINDWGPTIVVLLKALASAVPAIEIAITTLGIALAPKTTAFLMLLKQIAGNTAKDEVDELGDNIFDQLERFFNPNTPVSVR